MQKDRPLSNVGNYYSQTSKQARKKSKEKVQLGSNHVKEFAYKVALLREGKSLFPSDIFHIIK